MAKTIETQTPIEEKRPFGAPMTQKRTRVVVRKIGPWSVLKFSVLFYFCIMLVVLFAMYILYAIMSGLGTLDAMVKLLQEVSLVESGFEFNTGWIFARLFWLGTLMALLWSVINVFVAVLYNLISDVVGGVELTLGEKH